MYTPANVIAAIFGLSAFAVATISGLANGAAATDTLLRAVPLMIVFQIVGAVIGSKIESIAKAVEAVDARGGGKSVENSVDRVNHDGDSDQKAAKSPVS